MLFICQGSRKAVVCARTFCKQAYQRYLLCKELFCDSVQRVSFLTSRLFLCCLHFVASQQQLVHLITSILLCQQLFSSFFNLFFNSFQNSLALIIISALALYQMLSHSSIPFLKFFGFVFKPLCSLRQTYVYLQICRSTSSLS